ncbi:ribonuclease P/MRP protein subunit POP5 isoform X4 [Chelonia mydas]|uniref:ribonuclease P/MRP protein subunit POP5 isoform X4 n=1 Tax=Chelonia mydas TaxID=8469 RepID=UPI0018A23CAD|nr:ribonuclease P/MRP protein subunit POP5 isoform X4 [Chelonia mydas]
MPQTTLPLAELSVCLVRPVGEAGARPEDKEMVRFKHRYLLCEIISEDPRCRQCIDERAVSAAAKDAVARTHGDYGLACCSISFTGLRLPLLPDPLSRGDCAHPRDGVGGCPSVTGRRARGVRFSVTRVKYLNAYTGIVLLRCRKDFYRLLWSALPFVTYLENRNQRYSCFFNTLHVGAKS